MTAATPASSAPHLHRIKFVCLLTCPEGLAAMQAEHPVVPIYTAAVDRHRNEHGCILTGLGDVGDRIFGTK